MPKKFFRFRASSAPKAHTKPITRQYFSGPSHFLDANGNKITLSRLKNDPMFLDEHGRPRYLKSDGTPDMWKLRNAQNAGKINEFPNQAGRYYDWKSGKSRNGMAVSFEEAIAHLTDIAKIRLKEHALMFEVRMAKEAVEVFKRSFTDHKFRDTDSSMWKPLSPYTVKQRRRYGTNPSKILVDTGTLRRSIHQVGESGRVITDPSMYGTARRHKNVCYAGVHNDPRDFGATNVKARDHSVPRRQFMGHSSYLREKGWKAARMILFDQLFTPII